LNLHLIAGGVGAHSSIRPSERKVYSVMRYFGYLLLAIGIAAVVFRDRIIATLLEMLLLFVWTLSFGILLCVAVGVGVNIRHRVARKRERKAQGIVDRKEIWTRSLQAEIRANKSTEPVSATKLRRNGKSNIERLIDRKAS
jgi:hypothetical protein